MARDPRSVVDQVRAQAHQPRADDPPSLLEHPAGVSTPLEALRSSPEIAEIHAAWIRLHGVQPTTLAARALRRMGAATAAAEGSSRELTGDLVRAVDAVAQRCDDLAARLANLEELVQEVITVLGGDLVRLRASAIGPAARSATDAADPPDMDA
jgi:hypothetical protein